MRIAVITWPTLDNDYATHIIAGNNETDKQLSNLAYGWAVMRLSAESYKACIIALFIAELDATTYELVKAAK